MNCQLGRSRRGCAEPATCLPRSYVASLTNGVVMMTDRIYGEFRAAAAPPTMRARAAARDRLHIAMSSAGRAPRRLRRRGGAPAAPALLIVARLSPHLPEARAFVIGIAATAVLSVPSTPASQFWAAIGQCSEGSRLAACSCPQ